MGKTVKTLVYIFLLVLAILGVGMAKNIISLVKMATSPPVTSVEAFAATQYRTTPVEDEDIAKEAAYEVFVEGRLRHRFHTWEEAVLFATDFPKSVVCETGKSRWLWDNYPNFIVQINENDSTEFYTFREAAAFAAKQKQASVPSSILYRKTNSVIWTNEESLIGHARIDAPHISQFPELPRGCEVTSLAMLLQEKGLDVNKMTLASEIKKDPTEYAVKNGRIYYGNPNDGFVGDMYSYKENGLGVYHQPIYALLAEYLPDAALDLTGCSFEDLFYFLEKGTPVWVIINASYKPLPASSFETWHTPTGEIQITYKEHSVLLTGYDEKMIYFNDPFASGANHSGNSSVPRNGFMQAWEQMGRQAVTYAS